MDYNEVLSCAMDVGENIVNLKIDKLIIAGNLIKYVAEGALEKGILPENIIHFEKVEDLVEEVNNYIEAEDVVLVKASRGMEFERIVKKLKNT